MKNIFLAGYSGHGYVVAEIVKLLQYRLSGYFDIEEKKYNPLNLEYCGREIDINPEELKLSNISVALGAGDNLLRKKIYTRLKTKGISSEILLHPKASVSPLASVGEGVVVMASAVINPLANIGNAVICNSGCIVEHECKIADFTHIAPGAVLAGNVRIGSLCFIGANSVLKQGVVIGNNVTVGAGAVVLNNVPDNAVIFGNPARIKK